MFLDRTTDKIVSEYQHELSSFDVRKMLKVLEKAIDLPVEEESLIGIQRKYNYCISKLFDGSGEMTDDDFAIVADHFFRIEPLLKKILYIVDPNTYHTLKIQKALECGALLDHLRVLEGLRTNRGYLDLSVNPDRLTGNIDQEDHILRTYKLRNVTSHEMRDWSNLELFSHIQDVMITALFVCWKYRQVINEKYDINDINSQVDVGNFITRIIEKYDSEVQKGFVFVPINWSYVPNFSRGEQAEEEVSIAQLLTEAKENSHIILLGGAGCGKTTSVNYLEYNNALAWKNNNTAPIPVKISLSETNDTWISIEEAICVTLDIPYDICERLLSRGAINLYLDGVNEMVSSREIKTNIVRQIERFLKTYKNVFVLITDRENVEIKIEADLSTYYLHQMGEDDIKKYVGYMHIDAEQKSALVTYAAEMADKGVKFTPIILNYLAAYLKKYNNFPEDSTDFYLQYISYLLDREYNEKKDINAAPGRLDALLEYLAIRMDENETNYISTMRVFAQCVNYLGMVNIDTKTCLDLSLQLGILEQDGDEIHFANDEYYYSLLAKGINLGMEEWNID